MHTHAYTHTHTHAQMYMYTHTHTHTVPGDTTDCGSDVSNAAMFPMAKP